LAEAMLDNAMLKEIAAKKMVTPAARREAVAQLRVAFDVSERRACSTLGADRTSVRYRSRRPDDAPIRARLRELAAIRRRFGYRRLHILLVREGLVMNHKKLRRLYREEGLQVRRHSGRKRAVGRRAPITIPQGPNRRWGLDFASDALSDGRRFRILAVVDDFTREMPGADRRHVAAWLARPSGEPSFPPHNHFKEVNQMLNPFRTGSRRLCAEGE
jgi:putative transposase